jgi:ribokinase
VVLAIIIACPKAGTRMIVGTGEKNPSAVEDDIPEDVIRRARALHIDNFQPAPALKAARIARSAGVPVTMDLEFGGRRADEFLAVGDYIIVPLAFARRRYGAEQPEEGARALFEETAPKGAKAAVVTAGARGSFAVWADGAMHQPAYRAPTVVDTTGCGDVFHGAFALGLARGWGIERILGFASAVAALKCRKLGGRAGIPTEAEVREFLSSAEPLT